MKTELNYRIENTTGNICTFEDEEEFTLPLVGGRITLNQCDIIGSYIVLNVMGPFALPNRITYTVRLSRDLP
jgi:hypothetical protein